MCGCDDPCLFLTIRTLTLLFHTGSSDNILAAGAPLPLEDQISHTVLHSLGIGSWYIDHPDFLPPALELTPNVQDLTLPRVNQHSQDALAGAPAQILIQCLCLSNFHFKKGPTCKAILGQHRCREVKLGRGNTLKSIRSRLKSKNKEREVS